MSTQPRIMVLVSVISLMSFGSFLRTGVGCELGRSPGTRSAKAFGHWQRRHAWEQIESAWDTTAAPGTVLGTSGG